MYICPKQRSTNGHGNISKSMLVIVTMKITVHVLRIHHRASQPLATKQTLPGADKISAWIECRDEMKLKVIISRVCRHSKHLKISTKTTFAPRSMGLSFSNHVQVLSSIMQCSTRLTITSSMNTRVAGIACIFTRHVHDLLCYDDAAWPWQAA